MGVARTRAAKLPGVLLRSWRLVPQLSRTDRRELAIVTVLSLASEVGLRWLPLPRLAHLFGLAFDRSATAFDDVTDRAQLPEWALRRLRIVAIVMRRWPVDGECLRQSLVAGHRLRRLQPQLCIGVARVDRKFVAHAWLEIQGRSLDPSSNRYSVLPLSME
jgi:hypothetical protein